ncbi:MAG: hypothetical protein WA702_24450, partial [Bradyrhizobium sp.]|uniref:hypothetical protein n=1 Tax=Bradyrhizobium sp. TaxID=376 RepID=UPI003C7A3D41
CSEAGRGKEVIDAPETRHLSVMNTVVPALSRDVTSSNPVVMDPRFRGDDTVFDVLAPRTKKAPARGRGDIAYDKLMTRLSS